MADSYLPYQDPTTTSRKLDSESITVGANTVERERVQLAGIGDSAIAVISEGTPKSGSWAVVVRNIPSGTETVVITSIQDGSINVRNLTAGSVIVTDLKGGTLTTLSTLTSLTGGSVQLSPDSYVIAKDLKDGTISTLTSITNTVEVRSVIVDGIAKTIYASVLDYANSNPVAVRLTDTSGDYVAAGAGTQYTEGQTVAAPVGSVILGKDAANSLQALLIGADRRLHTYVDNVNTGTIATVASVTNLVSGSVQVLANSTISGITNTIETRSFLADGVAKTIYARLTGDGRILSDITAGSVIITDVKAGTINTVSSVTNVVAGSIQTVPGSQVVVSNITQGTLTTLSSVTTGSIQLDPRSRTFADITGGTITTVSTVSNLTNGSVQLLAGSNLIGTVAIVPTLMYSVTAATVGAGTSVINVAVASKKIKVYAYDLTTTATTYFEAKFAQGATTSVNLVVHGLVSATGNVVSGITKSVAPPAYLFATTAGEALYLLSSAAQPLNYNVSYWTSDAT